MSTAFTFTRSPSTKITTEVVQSGLVPADNTLILIGHLAASGSSVAAGSLTTINNYGDPVAAAAECTGYFGAGSEAGAMVVAAINAVFLSDLQNKAYPPIVVLALAHGDTSSTLATSLNAHLTTPMPFVASPYDGSDTVGLNALQTFLAAISANDRGAHGQFGSLGVIGIDTDTSAAVAQGVASSSSNISFGWLRDLAGTTANTPAQVAAALAALYAAMAIPYNPLNDVLVGGLVAPSNRADWHTTGDAGTVALGLNGGLTPLYVDALGNIRISRSITAQRTVSTTPDAAYYDVQDWQILYLMRTNAYITAQQPRYRQGKASDQNLQALKSELLDAALSMQSLGMLQHVEQLAALFTVARQPQNRYAAVYYVPVNVIPGFHNKGIDIVGTELFDIVVS